VIAQSFANELGLTVGETLGIAEVVLGSTLATMPQLITNERKVKIKAVVGDFVVEPEPVVQCLPPNDSSSGGPRAEEAAETIAARKIRSSIQRLWYSLHHSRRRPGGAAGFEPDTNGGALFDAVSYGIECLHRIARYGSGPDRTPAPPTQEEAELGYISHQIGTLVLRAKSSPGDENGVITQDVICSGGVWPVHARGKPE